MLGTGSLRMVESRCRLDMYGLGIDIDIEDSSGLTGAGEQVVVEWRTGLEGGCYMLVVEPKSGWSQADMREAGC